MACLAGEPFRGRRVRLATRRGKERVLARPFCRGLDLTVVVASGFDTDLLGTFSGERPCPADALETCRRKALAGMDHTCSISGWPVRAVSAPTPPSPG